MPGGSNRDLAHAEAKVIASRILARAPMLPKTNDQASMISGHKFNTLLADAQQLAAFVLERETEGANG